MPAACCTESAASLEELRSCSNATCVIFWAQVVRVEMEDSELLRLPRLIAELAEQADWPSSSMLAGTNQQGGALAARLAFLQKACH